MGDQNQIDYLRKHANRFKGPVLEVGARNYGDRSDIRPFFTNHGGYTGIDMSAGDGVDIVVDLTTDFAEIDQKLQGRRFGTIICMSVMEHCAQPFKMAENITKLLTQDGQLCLSVPFAWGFHGYPSDYWRFTHEGVKVLYPQLNFDNDMGIVATNRTGEFWPLDEYLGVIPFNSSYYFKRGYITRGIVAKCLGALGKTSCLAWLSGYRYVIPPTNVYMVGVPR